MKETSARKNILDKIKAALAKPTPLPFKEQVDKPLFHSPPEDPTVLFAEQFTGLGGKFSFCLSDAEFASSFVQLCAANKWEKVYCAEPALMALFPAMQWHPDVASCDVSLTSCERLVARTGSMLLSSAAGRVASVYAPVHVCAARTSQMVYEISDALDVTQGKYGQNLPSLITLATGPSRTADIEKTLVVGVHGPKEVYCFLIDDEGL
ncbi:LutC/YkgG family protein [Pseudocnuella soli]|uniref:LutC/YkgG family protein n=1 Tax=Pseudocnuella soli TaxID=2502779 RepID=UPI00104E865D|nr:LUD domain-containing protein [Pseudocnuella soli]